MAYGNRKLAALLLVSLLSIFSTARAGNFSWSWSSEDFDLNGTFSTPLTSGSITEGDVTAHAYTVKMGGDLIFTIDLVNRTLTFNDGSAPIDVESFHDFGYVIGQNRFQDSNPFVNDALFPVDFSILDAGFGFSGLYFEAASQGGADEWTLLQDDGFLTSTSGFDSGPVVSAVPEPSVYVTMLVGLGLVFSGLRARTRRGLARRVSLG